jgi:hypothetical protein
MAHARGLPTPGPGSVLERADVAAGDPLTAEYTFLGLDELGVARAGNNSSANDVGQFGHRLLLWKCGLDSILIVPAGGAEQESLDAVCFGFGVNAGCAPAGWQCPNVVCQACFHITSPIACLMNSGRAAMANEHADSDWTGSDAGLYGCLCRGK